MYINPDVKELHRIFDQNSRDGYLRVDLNENPGGLPEDFIDEVLADVSPEFLSKYPETRAFQEQLAEFIGTVPEEICLTNGSAEGIRHIIEAFTRPGGEIVSVAPSYAMYEVYSKMYGRKHIPVFYKEGFKVSAEDICAAVGDETDLVVVLNPNNPVGDVHSDDDMQMIIDCAGKHDAAVLIDEAYYYFYPKSFIKFALQNDGVLLTRTFSKLFSLAGCRLGYVVGRADSVNLVQKLCTPHNVNAFGIKFASAIMSKDGMIDSMVARQLEGKKCLADAMRDRGYNVNALEGNFIFIETKTPAAEVTKKLKEDKKILVKHYGNEMLNKYIRVTTGEKAIMQHVAAAIEEVDC